MNSRNRRERSGAGRGVQDALKEQADQIDAQQEEIADLKKASHARVRAR